MRPRRIVISSAVLAAVICGAADLRASADEGATTSLEERISRLAQSTGTQREPSAAVAEHDLSRDGRRIGPANGENVDPGMVSGSPNPAPGFAAGEHPRNLGNSESTSSGWVLSTITALGVVLGLILLLRWVWLRMGGRVVAGHSPVVETLSRTSVAPKNHVILVRVGSRILVCGDSPSGLRTLADIDDEREVADLLAAVSASRETSLTRGFNQMLQRFHGEHDATAEGGDDGEHRLDRARDSVSALLASIRGLAGKGGA